LDQHNLVLLIRTGHAAWLKWQSAIGIDHGSTAKRWHVLLKFWTAFKTRPVEAVRLAKSCPEDLHQGDLLAALNGRREQFEKESR